MMRSTRFPPQPRLLSTEELRTSDLQLFSSPKCHRIVQVTGGLSALTFAMLCEFDPRVDIYTERPHQVRIGPHTFDISFWLRYTDGSECFVLLTTYCTAQAPGWYEYSDAVQLRDAAALSGIDLCFACEGDVMAQASLGDKCLAMLPYVHAARRLNHHQVIREQICRIVERSPHRHLSHIVQAFDDCEPAEIRAVICDLIHGGLLRMDAASVPNVHACISGGAHHV